MFNTLRKDKALSMPLAAHSQYGKPHFSVTRIAAFTILLLLAVLSMYPFAWMLFTSLRDPHTVFTGSFILTQFRLDAYPMAWHQTQFGLHFRNSVIIAAFSL